jgi:hypothetical protein
MSMNNGHRKNVSVLGLAPVNVQSTSILGLPPISPPEIPINRAISRQERRILGAFHEDVLIMEGTAAKAEYGMFKFGEVQQYASTLFGSTVSSLLDNKNDLKGTEVEPYMNEFTTRQTQMYARHMLGALEITGTRIGELIHASLDLPPEKPSVMERIFGRRG